MEAMVRPGPQELKGLKDLKDLRDFKDLTGNKALKV